MKWFTLTALLAVLVQLAPSAAAQTATPTGPSGVSCTGTRAGAPKPGASGGECYYGCAKYTPAQHSSSSETDSEGAPRKRGPTTPNNDKSYMVWGDRPSGDALSETPAGGGMVDPESGSVAVTVALPVGGLGSRPICGEEAPDPGPGWGPPWLQNPFPDPEPG